MLPLLASSVAPGHPIWDLPLTVLIPLVGLPSFWLGAFIIYLIRCAIFGLDHTPRLDQLTKTPWLPRIIMEFGYWMFRIPVQICIVLGITPNMITFLSFLLTIVTAVLVGMGQFALGGWALLFAFTCDSWDGIVARATNQCSQAGEFFDSTIDRYNDIITFLGFLYYYRDRPLPLALTALGLIGSTVVSYARAKGDAFGVNANVGYMQRHERAVWLGAGTALAPIFSAYLEPGVAHPTYHLTVFIMGLLAAMTNITALWRIAVVMRALGRRPLGG